MHNSDLLKEKYMEIRTFGGGGRIRECERILRSRDLGSRVERLLLLPIPTTRDKKYITATDRPLGGILPLVDGKTLVVGYDIPPELFEGIKGAGGLVYDAARDEEFLIRNAVLTARGALGHLLTSFDRDISDMRIGIVGYGRIGSELLRLLLLFGCAVVVYTTRESVALELCEMGVGAAVISPKTDFSDLDILINTAPARQIESSALGEVQVIELASGLNFDPSERVTKLGSIPDALYPITAGRLYAEGAVRFMENEYKKV